MKNYFRDLLTENKDEATILLCGIPLDINTSIGSGASLAPDKIRDLSKDLPPVDRFGLPIHQKIYDVGNFVSQDFDILKEEVYKEIESVNDKFHIVLGGDHSIAIASEAAFYKKALEENKEPVIIHVDAHADICDIYKNNKYSHACPIKRALDLGYKPENITLLGIRSFELQELEILKNNPKIDVFKTSDIKKLGVEALLTILRSKYKDDKYKIYLSYDIDANDPSFAPGTGTPEHFGLSSFEVLDIIIGVIEKLNVKTMDLVEVSPPLDVNDMTSWLALKTLYEVFKTLDKKNNI